MSSYIYTSWLINDLDFVVDRNQISFAKQFANAIDAAFVKLEDQPATVRVVIRSDQSNIDFTQFRSDNLELDLRLRDLTINAIAFNLSPLMPLEIRYILTDLDRILAIFFCSSLINPISVNPLISSLTSLFFDKKAVSSSQDRDFQQKCDYE